MVAWTVHDENVASRQCDSPPFVIPFLQVSRRFKRRPSLRAWQSRNVEVGLTPLEAIAAATSMPAPVLGVPDVGTIEVGRQADIVLLSADPSIEIRNLDRIEAVVSRGELLDRAALDALLDRLGATLQATETAERAPGSTTSRPAPVSQPKVEVS